MTPSRFHTLLHKYLEGHATEEEEQQLFRFYASLQGKEEWDEGELGPSAVVEEQLRERLQQSIRKHEAKVVPLYRRPVFRVAAAAVLLFLVGSAGWWLLSGERRAAPVAQSPVTPATYEAPSGKASLVLGSGRVVLLDGRADGTVAREGSYHIIKQGQRIVYQPTGGRPTTQPHRLVTGKGRQWEVVLPDGSAAWLNTASELSFPASFARDERSVQLRGEAYFEVAKRTGQPFRVHVRPGTGAEALIEVLGTHFNVNAYTDEGSMKTTLLEGRVQVAARSGAPAAGSEPAVLQPGQQASIRRSGAAAGRIEVSPADTGAVLAWKKGLFFFRRTDISDIMRQVARWYDVAVVYEGTAPRREFTGTIPRSTSLETVLEILEQSGIRFRMEGRKIVVL